MLCRLTIIFVSLFFRQLYACLTACLFYITKGIYFIVCILKVYFASTSQKTIERLDLNGGFRDIIVSENLNSPEGLAIDWIHRRMYWTDKRCVV